MLAIKSSTPAIWLVSLLLIVSMVWSKNSHALIVGSSKYKSVQFVGFSINTSESHSAEECQLVGKVSPCYLGIENLVDDVEKRAAVMTDAVNTAYEHANHDRKILKVFVAPEFFWRGPNGAYPASSILDSTDVSKPNVINLIGRKLEALVQDERFNDWLFVFGTVVAINDLAHLEGQDQKLYYNFAPVYKGGAYRKGNYKLATKVAISDIDFLKDPKNASEVPYVTGKNYDDGAWNSVRTWLKKVKGYDLVQNNWFTMDGLSFSLEVCLDHFNRQALKSALTGYSKYPAQISLVTSAGMAPTENAYVLADKGYLFLQDGLGKANSYAVVRSERFLPVNFNYGTFSSEGSVSPFDSELSSAKCNNTSCAGAEYSLYSTPEAYTKAITGIFVSGLVDPDIPPLTVRIFKSVPIPPVKSLKTPRIYKFP